MEEADEEAAAVEHEAAVQHEAPAAQLEVAATRQRAAVEHRDDWRLVPEPCLSISFPCPREPAWVPCLLWYRLAPRPS